MGGVRKTVNGAYRYRCAPFLISPASTAFIALHRNVYRSASLLLDKLEFGGESPLTIRAWCGTIRYCPDPLGIVPAEQFDKLEFVLLIIGYHILPTQTLERHYPNNDMTTRLVF